MSKVLYFDCFSGISGDMTLGACVDAGVPISYLKKELNKLGLHEFELHAEKVLKNGIGATKVHVHAHAPEAHGHAHHSGQKAHSHRKYSDIAKLVKKSALSAGVKNKVLEMFLLLAKVEAGIHRSKIEEVHFHELGAVDTIVDIAGTVICLEKLGVEKCFVSPVNVGGMTLIKTSHGLLPNPAPATAELLKGMPFFFSEVPLELVTPTGACILKYFASPKDLKDLALKINSIGYGAGEKDIAGQPNALRVILGETAEKTESEKTAVIEANIDDLVPLAYEVVFEKLFKAGALDVFLTDIQMKKNRPAVMLSVVCAEEDIRRLSELIFAETTTFGLRYYSTGRIKLEKEFKVVSTKYGKVRMKLGKLDGKVMSASPEYEDCKKLSFTKNLPFKAVYEEAKRIYLR